MKNQMLLYYDEEGDFLEIMVGRPTKGYVVDIKPGIFQRVDEKTGKITGIAVLGFKKRFQSPRETKIPLPFRLEITA